MRNMSIKCKVMKLLGKKNYIDIINCVYALQGFVLCDNPFKKQNKKAAREL